MGLQVVALCVDADDPVRLARFWAAALRWETADDRDGATALVPTDGTRFRILFVPVTDTKTARNSIHLDLTSASIADQVASVDGLLELGGNHVDVGQTADDPHVVLADPEGNELCIIEPENRFLAGCGRLGSITCDGSPQAGYFWSEALGWPLVWDQDEETAIRAPDGTGPFITWGPPIPSRSTRNRLHLHLVPVDPADSDEEVDRLVALGATRVTSPGRAAHGVVLADPDGTELCLLTREHR